MCWLIGKHREQVIISSSVGVKSERNAKTDSKTEITDIPEDNLQRCWEVCYQEDSRTCEEETHFHNPGKKRINISKDKATSGKWQRKRSLTTEDIPDIVMLVVKAVPQSGAADPHSPQNATRRMSRQEVQPVITSSRQQPP